MSNTLSPTTTAVADLLISLGWRPSNDAQLTRLDEAVIDGRLMKTLFTAERVLCDYRTADQAKVPRNDA